MKKNKIHRVQKAVNLPCERHLYTSYINVTTHSHNSVYMQRGRGLPFAIQHNCMTDDPRERRRLSRK